MAQAQNLDIDDKRKAERLMRRLLKANGDSLENQLLRMNGLAAFEFDRAHTAEEVTNDGLMNHTSARVSSERHSPAMDRDLIDPHRDAPDTGLHRTLFIHNHSDRNKATVIQMRVTADADKGEDPRIDIISAQAQLVDGVYKVDPNETRLMASIKDSEALGDGEFDRVATDVNLALGEALKQNMSRKFLDFKAKPAAEQRQALNIARNQKADAYNEYRDRLIDANTSRPATLEKVSQAYPPLPDGLHKSQFDYLFDGATLKQDLPIAPPFAAVSETVKVDETEPIKRELVCGDSGWGTDAERVMDALMTVDDRDCVLVKRLGHQEKEYRQSADHNLRFSPNNGKDLTEQLGFYGSLEDRALYHLKVTSGSETEDGLPKVQLLAYDAQLNDKGKLVPKPGDEIKELASISGLELKDRRLEFKNHNKNDIAYMLSNAMVKDRKEREQQGDARRQEKWQAQSDPVVAAPAAEVQKSVDASQSSGSVKPSPSTLAIMIEKAKAFAARFDALTGRGSGLEQTNKNLQNHMQKLRQR